MEALNQWQPVTEVYQQISDPVPASHLASDPIVLIEAVRRARRKSEARPPLGITLITGSYFFRAAAYLLLGAKLITDPGSAVTGWIVQHCPSIVPFTLTRSDPEQFPTTMAEALGIMAVLTLATALLWVLRWKPVLLVTIAMAGYCIAHVAVSYTSPNGFGDPNLFASGQMDVLVLDSALNLLVFLYVALYPGLKQAFGRAY